MQHAEHIINRLEHGQPAFSEAERNLIVNYAYKLGNIEKTRELAEHIYAQEVDGNQDVALAMIDAQAEIDVLPIAWSAYLKCRNMAIHGMKCFL